MILYHFTNRKGWEGIEREGITRGFIPTRRGMAKGVSLTSDGRREAQHWATNETGACGDRLEYRVSMDLQEGEAFLQFYDFMARILERPRAEAEKLALAGGSDGESWYVAKAPIPRGRLTIERWRPENGFIPGMYVPVVPRIKGFPNPTGHKTRWTDGMKRARKRIRRSA